VSGSSPHKGDFPGCGRERCRTFRGARPLPAHSLKVCPGQGATYNTSVATASYLDRLLEPLTEAFTPRLASVLLELRADAELEARIDALRRKANSGTLTAAEEAEYEDFVEAVDLISIMQAKAGRFLAKQSA